MTVGICGVAVAGLLIGLSHTYLMLIVFLVLMGVAGSGYHPAAAPLISASVEPKNQGRALGVHMIGGSGSHFLSPLIAAAIAGVWGWRGSFIGLAIPTTALGIILYILLGRRAGKGKNQQTLTTLHNETPPPSPPSGRLRQLVAFVILSTFTHGVTSATIAFIPLFLVDHFGVGKETAAALLSIIYFAGLWASPLGGYLSDRMGRVRLVLAICVIAAPTVYLLNVVPYGVATGALLLIIGIFTYFRAPASEAYIISHTPIHRRSTVLGIYYFSSMEAGGALTPVLGFLIDRLGFYNAFTLGSITIIAVTLVCSVFLWRSRD